MTEPTADTGSFFDREAERYDALHDHEDSVGHALRTRIEVVLRLLGPGPGDVLDGGMGPGRLLAELDQRGWSVSGVDVSSEMVSAARVRLPGAAERLVQAPLESLPFESEGFDAAVATGVLEYVDDVPRTLAEVLRVLRPGGLFVVSMPNTHAVRTVWRHRVVYPAVRTAKKVLRLERRVPLHRPGLLSLQRLRELLDAAGFEFERVEYIGFLVVPAPFDRLFPSLAVRAASRLEGLGPRSGRLLGAHLVVAARKAGASASAPLERERVEGRV